MSCLIITPEIKELATKFPSETEESIKGLVSLWQEKNNKSIDEYPDVKTLGVFMGKVRGAENQNKALNIYYGTNENAHLSNFAVRPFIIPETFLVETPSGMDISYGVALMGDGKNTPIRPARFNNVESAFQFFKTQYQQDVSDETFSRLKETGDDAGTFRKQFESTTGPQAKAAGRRFKNLDRERWDKDKEVIMKALILESFKQNPDAAAQLLATGNATLTHTQDRGEWGTLFPKLLMEVRNELRNSESSLPTAIPEEGLTEDQLIGPSETQPSQYREMSTPVISSAKDQEMVDLEFDPVTRRDRVTLIARMFSEEVDKLHKEKVAKLKDRISSATGALKAELEQDLREMTRFRAIESETPYGVFSKVNKIFSDYVESTEEEKIQAELDTINATEGADQYSEEEKLAAAKRRAEYKNQEYQKIIKHFKPLAEETSSILLVSEGLRIDPNYVAPQESNNNDDTPEGESQGDMNAEDWSLEEAKKDGWMTNVRQVSAYESLSQAVRAAIRQVPKLDADGYIDEDDLGFTRYLDADYVHSTLLDKLRVMYDSEDMLPLLRELTKTKPWVEQVVELLENDETLFSQFYQDFMKDFVPYWIQKKRMKPDGTFKIETIALNKPEGVYYLLDAWRDNYESGYQLDKDSIYEKNGDLNRENARKGLALQEELNNKFNNLTTEERLKLLEDPKVWSDIMKLLHMIGIDANPATLRVALTDIKNVPGITFTDPIMLLLPQLNIILGGVADGKVKTEVREDGTVKKADLINTFGTAYNSIAKMIADVSEDAIESSVRENDKSHYSHVNPNYLGKLIKKLKNVNPNKALSEEDKKKGYRNYFDKFIQEEFKQYEWFFKDGHWRSDWLEKLATDSKYRDALQHKVLLNHDKIEYSDWDSLDYTIVLLNEYWAEPKEGMAWYHVPILSDSPSAEFIRFVRYKEGLDENGNKVGYKELILDKLVDLVNQEYDRIQLVRERDELYQSGVGIEPIANYDISRDKDGNIKSLGGAEFKFLPALNSIKYDTGETFLDRLASLQKNGSGEELRDFIKSTLEEVIENQFEDAYRKWESIGLLEELPNGMYKNLPFTGQSTINENTAKALKRASELMGRDWTPAMDRLLNAYLNNRPIVDKAANEIFSDIKDYMEALAENGTIEKSELKSLSRNLNVKNNAKEALREYFWNSKHATSQIIQLTTTDLAFYKNMEDFQKRFKEVHAPSLRLNTKATWKGERVGRDWERTIYLKDDEIISNVLSDIVEVILAKHKNGELSDYSAAYILSKYGYTNHSKTGKNGKSTDYVKIGDAEIKTEKVNVADAQAYRSLSSYKAMMVMSGQWTDAMDKAYNNFLNGNWDIEDFTVIWQTKKPYVYTQINNESGAAGHTGIKTPVQHKNSEFLLLAAQALVSGPLGKSGKLRAINDFMERNGIDVVQFESTTKVGKQGVIDINNLSSYQDTIDALSAATGIKDAKASSGIKASPMGENPNVVHKVSYEDYGIQTATPEHGIDAMQLVGTQIRKLITADISDDTIIEVDGKKLTKRQWLDLYNRINTENIIDKFSEIDKIFKDPKQIEKVLLDEIRSNARYGQDMMRACTLDENGNFTIPLFDPVQSQRVQTLLNSIIKSRITKQKIKGGALIQVSSYGLSDNLKIVWEGEGANKRIKYMECYMPAYSKDFYEPLMDPVTHQLDVTKLPEDLRKLIGYRVPTEDKYSMAPLYIKGFLPQQNGSAIMLPAEITTIAGSDFDVDKMYIMLPEFRITKYDYQKAKYYYAKEAKALNNTAEVLSRMEGDKGHGAITDMINNLSNEDQSLNAWIEQSINNGDPYGLKLDKPIIRKVKYNYSKTASQNNWRARNNLLIDMMWGVLTNPDTVSKMINPGGFDEQKKTARVINILTNMSESELRNELTNAGVKFNKVIHREDANGKVKTLPAPLSSYLFNLPMEVLNKITERFQGSIDPLSPMTQLMFHQQNMTGAKLIGIYANHNANHALMQHTQLALDAENGAFFLNGKKNTSLHAMKNADGEYISRLNAGFLAASVDNVKDPVLAWLNQNTFTADASMLLSRLGYNSLEIGLLMNQPIIMEITQAFFREGRTGKGKDTIIDRILEEYKKKSGETADLSYDSYKGQKFYIEDLAENIILAKEMQGIDARHSSDFRKVEYYSKQLSVGYLFKRIMTSADALSKLTQATRADTQGGAAGPTIADTIIKIQKVADFVEDSTKPKFPLVGVDVIEDLAFDENESIDSIREKLLSSRLPFLQAFYSLGIKQTEQMLKAYFPQYTESFQNVIDTLRKRTKKGKLDVKTMNNIYNDLLAYIMSKTSFFGSDRYESGEEMSSRDKRAKFINEFPAYFKELVSSNEDIAGIEFIKRLKVVRANDQNPVDTLVFKNVGRLSNVLRERYMRDWATLLYMGNPKARELALNLFRYSYYRNGFAFGPNTFIHLAPVAVRLAVPEYIETLRTLMENEDDYSEFIDQYILNHLDNKKFVPEISDDATVKFVDENKDPKDRVEFSITDRSSYEDKKVVRERIDIEGTIIYDFFEYISKRVGGKYVYYKLNNEESTEDNAVYERISPLGYKHSFIEYEYGVNADEVVSVIKKNDLGYDPLDDVVSQSITQEEIDYDSQPDMEGAYSGEALNSMYQEEYGVPFTESGGSDKIDMTAITPNTNFTDANDQEPCTGAPTIYTL